MMIEFNEITGHSTNGENKQITLNERQIYNLLNIIKVYKEELCCSLQDIQECEELIKPIKE